MTIRSGMATLINRVRELTAESYSDYLDSPLTHWDDSQIQDALDRCRLDVTDEAVSPLSTTNSGGTVEYRIYQSTYHDWEETTGGTAIFWLRDGTGARVGTAFYSPDYARGRFEFTATTGGSVLYASGAVYDVWAAAADIWRQKAAQVANRFDFSADGASFKASQLVAQYEERARACERRATFGAAGVQTITMFRDDVNVWRN